MNDSGAHMPFRRLRTIVLTALGSCLAASALLVTAGLAAGNPDAPDLTGYFPPGNGLTVNAFVDAKTAPGKTLYRFDTVIQNSPSAGVLDLYKPAGTLAASQTIWPGGEPPSAPIGKNDVPPGARCATSAPTSPTRAPPATTTGTSRTRPSTSSATPAAASSPPA